MADVQHLKDKGIPLKIDGTTRFVKGASKYTTCGDVIKMVLKKTGVKKEYRHLFTIYEVTMDEENALSSKSKITKVIESWKGEPNRLVLRKSEPLTPVTVNERKKRWNLTKKPKEQRPEVRKTKDTYVQTLQSIVEMVDKQREQIQTASGSEDRNVDGFTDSTTDSDSSMDEFLSKLDHSKMAGLINFFAAMATRKPKRDFRRRAGSTSTQDSDDSSDSSPVKPKKRNIKKVRQPLLKKSRSRNSRSRMKEGAHMHPNKMHAVKRVNFGFIDVEPRSQDRVYSMPDVRSNDGHETNVQSNSNRMFSVRRRLIPSRKCSYNVESENGNTGLCSKFTKSLSGFNTRTEPRRPRRLSENCREVWCESPISSIDSGHEASSDSSSDLDTAFVPKNNPEEAVYMNHYMDTPENDRLFRNFTSNHQLTSSVRKLVEYSITDDELDDTDSDYLFETEDEGRLGEVKGQGIFKSNCQELDNSQRNTNNTCANDLNKDTYNGPETKHDVTNYIKSLFGKTVENEDDEMSSFMRSMVLNDSSDEGLSSMGSDLDSAKCELFTGC